MPQDGETLAGGKIPRWKGWAVLGCVCGRSLWTLVTAMLSDWNWAGVALCGSTAGGILLAGS